MQVTVITMSSTPTYAKSPSIQKVNSFLFENPETTPLDSILLDHRPSYIARCDMMSMEMRGDAKGAQESKTSKACAWKRRRKREDEKEAKPEKTPGAGPTGAQPAGSTGAWSNHRTHAGYIRRPSGASRVAAGWTGIATPVRPAHPLEPARRSRRTNRRPRRRCDRHLPACVQIWALTHVSLFPPTLTYPFRSRLYIPPYLPQKRDRKELERE